MNWLDQCHFGDCRDLMRAMIADGVKVQTIVTSPPYWGLRDYGVGGQIGQEPTLREFIDALVDVFELCRELLADDGTAWVNMGDAYVGSRGAPWGPSEASKTARAMTQSRRRDDAPIPRSDVRVEGLKPKDVMGQPWRLAFALQDAGWYLRQDIIWHKPNPMPESVRDRCTKAHEYVFLLSKSSRYYFDADAIAEPFADSSLERLRQDVTNQKGSERVPGKTNGTMKAVGLNANRSSYKPGSASAVNDGERLEKSDAGLPVRDAGRNKRSVWTVTTQPFKEAHFATYPPKLIEPCILAGCPAGGMVLDPFGGAGTTAGIALKHGRKAILCELNPEYAKLVPSRISSIAGLSWDLV